MGLDPLYHTDPEHTQTLSLSDDSSSRKSRSNPLANIKSKMDLGESLSSHDLNMAHQHGDHGFYKQAHAYVHGGGMTKRRKQLGVDLDPNTDDKKKDEKENGEKKNIEKNKDGKENKTENTIGAEHELTGHLNGSQRLSTDSKSAFITTTTPEEKKKTQQVESDQTGNTVTQTTTVTDGVPESNTTNATDAKVKAEDKTVEGTKKDVSGVVDKKTGGVEEKKLKEVVDEEVENEKEDSNDEQEIHTVNKEIAAQKTADTNPLQVDTNEAELEALRKHAKQQKLGLKKITHAKEAKLIQKSTQEKKAIDIDFAAKQKEVGGYYDAAISRVQKSYFAAQKKSDLGKKQQQLDFQKKSLARYGSIDTITKSKQDELTESGECYAQDSLAYGKELQIEAVRAQNTNHGKINANADNAIAPYKGHEYETDVITDVRELAGDIRENVSDATSDLYEDLSDDSSEMAEKFRDEAAVGVEKIPEGKEVAKKNIAAIYAEGIKQFDSVSNQPLTELKGRLDKVVTQLQTEKKRALYGLKKQQQDAHKQIDTELAKGKKSLRDQEKIFADEVDTVVSETETEAQTMRPDIAKKLIAAAEQQITQSSDKLSVVDDGIVLAVRKTLTSVTVIAKQNFKKASASEKPIAENTATNAELGASQTADGMISSYQEVVKQMTLGMDNEVKRYTGELDKVIAETQKDWDKKLAEGKEGMRGKYTDVQGEIDTLVVDSEEDLKDQAEDSSSIDLWDIAQAVISFVWGAIKVIAAILIVALVIFALVEIISALFVGFLVLLAEAGFGALATLLALAADALVLFIADFLASTLYLFVIAGVGFAIKKGVDTYNNKNLTRNEKAEGYGGATADAIVSILPFWAEIKGIFRGANVVAEEEALVNAEKSVANEMQQQNKLVGEVEGAENSNFINKPFVPVKQLRPYEVEAMDKFRAANNAGILPKHKALYVEKPLSTDAMRMLSQEFGGIEVAQVFYKTPKGGYTRIVFGEKNFVNIPAAGEGESVYLISHTHPGGTPIASEFDIKTLNNLKSLQEANSVPIQKSSTIIPNGGKNVKFNSSSKYNSSSSKNISNTSGLGEVEGNITNASKETIVEQGGSKNNWNSNLNGALEPNKFYNVDGYIYETDEIGRVIKVEGELRLSNRGRNIYQQQKSVALKGGTAGEDDGGHLIAQIFHGPGEQINYLPMIKSSNRYAEWRTLEREWEAALNSNQNVQVEIIPNFTNNSLRPNEFDVRFTINGIPEQRTIPNN